MSSGWRPLLRACTVAVFCIAGSVEAATPPAGQPATAPRRMMRAPASESLAGMVSKVAKRWALDCGLPGVGDVVVAVRFTIASDGSLAKGPELVRPEQQGTLLGGAALNAVSSAAPFSLSEVPAEYRNLPITMNFFAKKACSLK